MDKIAPPIPISSSKSAAQRMKIDTYFGFFAEAVMHAITTSMTGLTGQSVNLDTVHLSNTNTIKLRFGDVETVMRPVLAAKVEVGFLFAFNEHDIAALTRLCEGRMPFHKMMEQVISTAAEEELKQDEISGLSIKDVIRRASFIFSQLGAAQGVGSAGGAKVENPLTGGDLKPSGRILPTVG